VGFAFSVRTNVFKIPATFSNRNMQRVILCHILLVSGATAPQWATASSFLMFLDHTQRRTTFGMTSLDVGSARRRDLYLTTHNTYNRQTSMNLVGFESKSQHARGRRPTQCHTPMEVSLIAVNTHARTHTQAHVFVHNSHIFTIFTIIIFFHIL